MTASYIAIDGAVWSIAERFTPLDEDGYIIPSVDTYTTDALMKATLTPVNEAGDAIAIKNASGNLGVFAIKGDIPKWYTVQLDFVTPDPYLEALICGGTVFTDTSVALGAPADPPTAFSSATGGSLGAGTYDYSYGYFNAYGQSPDSSDVIQIVSSGATNVNVVTPSADLPAGALGIVLYGRSVGSLRLIAVQRNIGAQVTSADSGTGTVTALTVTALTSPVPPGTTFSIVGDTNTPNIVFTTTAGGIVGDTTLAVSAPTITTTIAGGDIQQVLVDDGSAVPAGIAPTVDRTGGPGLNVGYQTPAPGTVPNPNGFGLEFFMERIEDGHQATDWPFYRFLLGKAANFVQQPSDVTNANFARSYMGEAFPNPNFDAGPEGDWQFDSSEILQWTVCGRLIVPIPSPVPVPAGY